MLTHFDYHGSINGRRWEESAESRWRRRKIEALVHVFLCRRVRSARHGHMTMLQHEVGFQPRRHVGESNPRARSRPRSQKLSRGRLTTRARRITKHPKMTTTAANAQDRWPPSAVLARRNNASRWQSGKPGRGTYQQRRHGTKEGVACQKRRRRLATFRTFGTVESGWGRWSRVRVEGQEKKDQVKG